MVINRIVSNGFYCTIDLDPSIVPSDQFGNRLIIDIDECLLDTGGLLHQRIAWKRFQIGKANFAIQPHNAERAVHLIETTRVDHGDYSVFKMWNYDVYLKPEICDGVLEYLRELAISGEAAHAELDAHQDIQNLESDTLSFISVKGRTPQEIAERLRKMGF